MFRHKFLRGGNGFFHRLAVETEPIGRLYALTWRVHHDAFLGVEALFAHIGPLYQRDNRQIEVFGEGIVATVVCRNSHNGPGSIACEHVFRNPNGQFVSRERVKCITSAENPRHFAVAHAVKLGALLHIGKVFGHFGLLFRRCQLLNQLALGGQYHERDAENCVGSSCKDSEVPLCF